ncbi:hypothetical protein [Kribbella solani]|uniref:Uncharacterized protein n=1 Tax=Kribbella solani TaxID=236067 RepID=A0A841DIV6_9ACTN|nr:hypothetical protein [Kribbella solani]MBB5976706.1 hypothetical protein [Kribbella solani]MDX2970771.1 hypothetical protein [Kribbella solani]MDX3006395.1 hypothetical protein [Kribbella solani]
MTSTKHRHLTIHDVVRPEPPLAVRGAITLWFTAIGAGVAESVLGALGAIGDGTPVFGLLFQIAFRAIVYGGLFVVVDRYFRPGVAWARWLLAGLLGTVGIASLLVGPVDWLLHDGDFGTVHWSASFIAFAAIRCVHVSAVITAILLSFQPDANRWFSHRAVRRTR